MTYRALILIGSLIFPVVALSSTKPLLTNSQDTFASACVGSFEPPDRVVEICQKALAASGASTNQRLEFMNSLAWAYSDLDRIQDAEETFKTMLNQDAKSTDAMDGLAWIKYDRGDYADAVELFGQAMEISMNARALAGLGASLLRAEQADLEKGFSYLDTAMAIDPEFSWALREKAWILNDHGRHEEALEYFKDALDVNPDDKFAQYGAAYVLSEMDRWEPALPFVSRAIELDPDYISARSRRSLILLYLDRPKQALKDGQFVMKSLPDDADGYVRVARAFDDLGRREDAIVLLSNANAQIGYNSYLIYWLSTMLFYEDRNAKALAQINRVVAKGDADFFDYHLQSRIAVDLGDFELARQANDQALALEDDDIWARYYDARILVAEGEFDKAEIEFDRAVAAGLPRKNLKDFLSVLVGEGRFMQAIQMRVRYSDME